jgi:hypothetical protein
MIVSKVNYDELILGDKNAILVASRILGFGAEYPVEITDKYGIKIPVNIDLSLLENKQIDETLFEKGKNEFNLILPQSKEIMDEPEIEMEII